MSRIMHCSTLQEAVDFLKEDGAGCGTIAAYLYAAGVDKAESTEALKNAGFDAEIIKTCLDTLYTVVTTEITDRLRTLHLLMEAEAGD
ncbi:MAG: hypothetical protein ACYTFO_01780 [Planctomycetota bacterium]|jgi:hypothetical protein